MAEYQLNVHMNRGAIQKSSDGLASVHATAFVKYLDITQNVAYQFRN